MGLLRARNVTPSKHGKHYRERSAGVLFHNCTTLHLEDFPYPPPGDVPDISQSWTIKTNTWTQSSLFKIRKKIFYGKRNIDDIKVAPLFRIIFSLFPNGKIPHSQAKISHLSSYLFEQSPDIILVIIPDGSFPGG